MSQHAHGGACSSACARSRSSPMARPSAAIGRRHASVREINPYETPFRPFLPSTAYALAASRHMHQFGTTREQMAAVAVAARQWALLNPVAWEKKPLTVAEVLVGADGQLSVHGARHLPRHRWRRRDRDHDHRRARQIAEKAAGLRARLRPGHHPRQYFEHARPDRDRRARNRAAQAYAMAGLAAEGHRRRSSSTTRSRSTRSCSSKISASARRARAARLSRAAASPPAAHCRSTPMAAASPIAIPACTACSC